MSRVVLLIVVNATMGLILKSFMAVPPIFTIFYQVRIKSKNLRIILDKSFGLCQNDYFCSTIDRIGRNLILVNMAIPFLFFYKFDLNFKECFQNLVENMKKKLKKNREKNTKALFFVFNFVNQNEN